MLLTLSIRNIVTIEQLDIELHSGFCVLTGETGAGKSILLDALGFVLGARASSRLVRSGSTQGIVAATFDISTNSTAQAMLAEQELAVGEEIVLRRTLTPDGKSKAFVNDLPVSAALLKNLGELLVEVHGQHEQHGLLSAVVQRAMVDEYGAHQPLLQQLKTVYEQLQAATAELAALEGAREKAAYEEDYLRHILKELEQLTPQVGEEETLADRRTLLMNSEKLMETIQTAMEHLEAKGEVSKHLLAAQRGLARYTAQPERFQPVIETLDRALVEVSEAQEMLHRTLQELDVTPAELETIEERLFALRGAGRKFNMAVDKLPAFVEEVRWKLSLLTGQGVQLDDLQKQLMALKSQFSALAADISKARKAAAKKLQTALLKELAQLKMEKIRFDIVVEPLTEEGWSALGADKVTFMAAMNSGSNLEPLAKIASGGELSRFMLALKVVLLALKSVPTLIFDEVDTGIGGAVADAVGKRLALLGKRAQVLVVTHQPQVAAGGAAHFKVTKEERKGHTYTSVRKLSSAERQEELARMLAGETVTKEARAAAKKLLALSS